jgi:hypothetical protein
MIGKKRLIRLSGRLEKFIHAQPQTNKNIFVQKHSGFNLIR